MDAFFHATYDLTVSSDIPEPIYYSLLNNNDARIKCTIGCILKHKAIPKIERRHNSKDPQKALRYINHGKIIYKSMNYLKSSTKYTKALIYSLTNSDNQSRAYAGRSAVWYKLGFYNHCLLDIDRALKINYPDNRKAELYTRRALSLLALNKIATTIFDEAIADARLWSKKMNQSNQRQIKYILDSLYSKKVCQRSSTFSNNIEVMPETPIDNPMVHNASGAIKLEYTKDNGRHIIATRDIKAGEALAVHKAYVAIPVFTDSGEISKASINYTVCWHCSLRVWSGVPCHQCVNVIYCNEVCRDAAWTEYHDIECPIITVMFIKGTEVTELMALRLTIKAIKEVGTLETLKQKLQTIDSIADPITKGFEQGKLDCSRYPSVYTLMKTEFLEKSTSFMHSIKSANILFILAGTTEILGKKLFDISEIMNNEWAIFIGGLILTNYEICASNPFARCVFDEASQTDLIRSYTLWPFMCLFNHSCDPSTCVLTEGDVSGIIAVRGIKKGEHIYLSYHNCSWIIPRVLRRKYLRLRFNFLCSCLACEDNWRYNPDVASCMEQMITPEIKMKMEDQIKFFNDLTAMQYKNRSNTAEVILSLKKIINFFSEHVTYPCEELINMKLALTLCYEHVSS